MARLNNNQRNTSRVFDLFFATRIYGPNHMKLTTYTVCNNAMTKVNGFIDLLFMKQRNSHSIEYFFFGRFICFTKQRKLVHRRQGVSTQRTRLTRGVAGVYPGFQTLFVKMMSTINHCGLFNIILTNGTTRNHLGFYFGGGSAFTACVMTTHGVSEKVGISRTVCARFAGALDNTRTMLHV
tara:strand:+ start:343 stop:885 length:543 start_codon:yes stop_codon:yes gene_type:complete